MKVTKITIQNYRSIKSEIIIPTQFSIFVGQNNHGKTNIFEAVDWFFNKPRKEESIENVRHGRSGIDEVFVEIEFCGAQEGINSMKNEGNQTKIAKLLDKSDLVSVKRSSNDPSKRVIFVNGVEKPAPTGFDNALNDFLPKFEYVDTKKYYEELAKFGRTATPISTMLSGVLEKLLESNDDYQQFRKKFESLFQSEKSQIKIELDKLSGKVKVYLEKQFPDCVKVEFTVSEPSFDELLKNFDISIHDGITTNADEKGDGMQRALMLAIIQTYADYRKETDDTGKTFLFFIDEAELHLHPTAQRYLKNALYELSEKGDQVFINTHSSVFVAGLTRRARKYYLGVSIISQQANDFLNNEYGKAIASQSSFRVLMRQDTTTIKKVASEFNLSEYEQKFLLTCDKGEALIIADQNHVAVKVVASEKEHPLITTNPAELFLTRES